METLYRESEGLYREGKYRAAIPYVERFLEIREKAPGPDPREMGRIVARLAELYDKAGDYRKAEVFFQRALATAEKDYGQNSDEASSCLNNLAGVYDSLGQYSKAEELYGRSLSICETLFGASDPRTGAVVNNLALLLRNKGEFAKAESLYQRALRISERTAGTNSLEAAGYASNLAGLYDNMGRYAEAEPLYLRALKIRHDKAGPNDPQTANTLNNLAGFYMRLGKYAKARPLVAKALEIFHNTAGPDHPDTVLALENLASCYMELHDYARASALYERALNLWQKDGRLENPSAAKLFGNFAHLYASLEDYRRAVPLAQAALEITIRAFGTNNVETAYSLSLLAGMLSDIGDYTNAMVLNQKALTIEERALGPSHPLVANRLHNLAALHKHLNQVREAETLYKRALDIKSIALLPDHHSNADTLGNLGGLYHEAGEFSKAKALLERALTIYDKGGAGLEPRSARIANNLAFLELDIGNHAKALELIRRAEATKLKSLSNILSFAPEHIRLSYQSMTFPYSMYAALGQASDMATAVLRHKGVVIDSLLEDRLMAEDTEDPSLRGLMEEYRTIKLRLGQVNFNTPPGLPEKVGPRLNSEEKSLRRRSEQIEAILARRFSSVGRTRRSLAVTVNQVQLSLPESAVLIDFIHYPHYLGRNRWEAHYGAVILGAFGAPHWIPLGEAVGIDKELLHLQRGLRSKMDDEPLAGLLHKLYQRLWLPVQAALPGGIQNVVISPDAELNFLSFATLLTPEDVFLAEKYSISYVSSGRDLLVSSKSTTNDQMVVYANPNFSSNAASKVGESSDHLTPLHPTERRDFQSLQLAPLLGTAREGAALEAVARKWNRSIQKFLGDKASEASLHSVQAPNVLHLATHGFFINEDIADSTTVTNTKRGVGGIHIVAEDNGERLPRRSVIRKNPMHRSALALAGAQTTLDLWRRGEVPATDNDGILTAEEVGGLSLSGTWLVTLSACDTGTGEARSGEGVIGLRRGFIQAGAQNLLMTLWTVADEETIGIMANFYEFALRTGNAPRALADVQRNALIKLRAERGLQAAVKLAGPFIMSSQGPIR